MSNLIPPHISSSPPPIIGNPDEENDDEFGDFSASTDPYDCDDILVSRTEEKEIIAECGKNNLHNNQANAQEVRGTAVVQNGNTNGDVCEAVEVTFQGPRKISGSDLSFSDIQLNFRSNSLPQNANNDFIDAEITNIYGGSCTHEVLACAEKNDDSLSNSKSECHEVIDYEVSCQDKTREALEIEPSQHKRLELNLFDEKNGVSESNSDLFLPVCIGDSNFGSNFTEDFIGVDCDHTVPNELTKLGNESLQVTEIKSNSFENTGLGEPDTQISAVVPKNIQVSLVHDKHQSEVDSSDDESLHENLDTGHKRDEEYGDFKSSEVENVNFNIPTEIPDIPITLFSDMESVLSKTEMILKDVFVSLEEEVEDFKPTCDLDTDGLFNILKDVTETNALFYVWSKSKSQKLLLKALNIDIRNILYGSAWNSSMPKCIQNSGATPLEPVKSQILMPTPMQSNNESKPSQKLTDMPTARFDWGGSGLVNPLYNAPLPELAEDSIENIPSLATTSSLFLPSINDTVMNIASAELQEPENIQQFARDEAFENLRTNTTPVIDHLPMSSGLSTSETPTLVHLRETHIFEDIGTLDKTSYLQSVSSSLDSFKSQKNVTGTRKHSSDVETTVFSVYDSNNGNRAIQQNAFENTGTSQPSKCATEPFETSIFEPREKAPVNVENDDEFTDFHSSVPLPNTTKSLPTISMEPLKPLVKHNMEPCTQINWPDPGLTDEDSWHIDLNYNCSQTEYATEEIDFNLKSLARRKTKEKGNLAMDDGDEWSDFVSVDPVCAECVASEKTSDPKLGLTKPLSMLNLNYIQPSKTKCEVPTSNILKSQMTNLQPSILSNDTVIHPSGLTVGNVTNNLNVSKHSFPKCKKGLSASLVNHSPTDEDDWSDFVSSEVATQTSCNFQQGSTLNTAEQSHFTKTFTIPTHFEMLENSAPRSQQNKKVLNVSVPCSKPISSTYILPDLDFVLPKLGLTKSD